MVFVHGPHWTMDMYLKRKGVYSEVLTHLSDDADSVMNMSSCHNDIHDTQNAEKLRKRRLNK